MVKVAGIQMHCLRNREANLSVAVSLGATAADYGAGIICFPEIFHLFWFPHRKEKQFSRLAEPIDGETITTMRELAAKKKVALICPIFEIDRDLFFNTAVIIGKDGQILGKYRKAHLPDIPLWYEKYYFTPGNTGFPVFESHGIHFGVLICWDVFFPEAFRLLTLTGVQMVFCPTASAFDSQNRWETMIRAQAIANGIYIFRVNRVGKEEEQEFYGAGFCTDPYGDIICDSANNENSIIFTEIKPESCVEARKTLSFLADRRPELYKDLARTEPE